MFYICDHFYFLPYLAVLLADCPDCKREERTLVLGWLFYGLVLWRFESCE